MAAGFQMLETAGSVVLDLSDRIAKVLGVLSVGASYTGASMAGNVTDARFTSYAGTTPWFAIISSTFFRHAEHPVVSIAGTTLSWQFPTGSSRPDTTIIYGIF
jgi:hypothetical protein